MATTKEQVIALFKVLDLLLDDDDAQAISELADAVAATKASGISLLDIAEHYTAEDVEAALAEALAAIIAEAVTARAAEVAAATAAGTSIADAGEHFPAATNTAEKALQTLAAAIAPITIPRFTGWTKDASDQTVVIPLVELPFPAKIVRAYANLGTAPGTGKTLVLKIGADTLVTIAEDATQGEGEALDIALAADTDIVILANETAGGAGANCDLILVLALDDGE